MCPHCLDVLPKYMGPNNHGLKSLKLWAKINLLPFSYHCRYFSCRDKKSNKDNTQWMWANFLHFSVVRSCLVIKIQLKCHLCEWYASSRSKLRACLMIYLPLSSHILFLASLPIDSNQGKLMMHSLLKELQIHGLFYALIVIHVHAYIHIWIRTHRFLNNKLVQSV